MAWSGLLSNQMVSEIDAQTSGFTLNSGQSHGTTNLCLTKANAFTKYNLLATINTNALASNQLIRKDFWQVGVISTTIQKNYYYYNNTSLVCGWVVDPAVMSIWYVAGNLGLVNGSRMYYNSNLSGESYTVPDDSKWYISIEGSVRKYFRISTDGYTAKDVGTCV